MALGVIRLFVAEKGFGFGSVWSVNGVSYLSSVESRPRGRFISLAATKVTAL